MTGQETGRAGDGWVVLFTEGAQASALAAIASHCKTDEALCRRWLAALADWTLRAERFPQKVLDWPPMRIRSAPHTYMIKAGAQRISGVGIADDRDRTITITSIRILFERGL